MAHLDDEERSLVLGVLLEEVLSWVRALPGSQRLRALVVFDEVYGFMPPHPANPPTKRPLVALMKQARAFGVGVVVATQNPMDLDYRALGNAGLWCVGRLQTDADREVQRTLRRLAPRWFLLRDAHSPRGPVFMQPRWAMSYLRGPMTRNEIQRARGGDWGEGRAVLFQLRLFTLRETDPQDGNPETEAEAHLVMAHGPWEHFAIDARTMTPRFARWAGLPHTVQSSDSPRGRGLRLRISCPA